MREMTIYQMLQGRFVSVSMLNDTGSALAAGAVCYVSDGEFKLTTTEGLSGSPIVVIPDEIPDGESGRGVLMGHAAQVNLESSGAVDDYIITSSTSGQAKPVAALQDGIFGQLLTAGTNPEAILFTIPAAAEGGRVLIEEVTPTGSNVSFDSIPNTYKHLEIEYIARSDRSAADEGILISLNADLTDANYRRNMLNSYGTTVAATSADDRTIGFVPAASAPSNSAGTGTIRIIHYAQTTFNKQAMAHCAYRYDASTLGNVNIQLVVEWEDTDAISSIDIDLVYSNNFITGSTFRLYGVY